MRVAEFFAGLGLARIGLERAGHRVVWANDIEPFKHRMYVGQFGDDHPFVVGDVRGVRGADMPDIDAAWASFPCTDVSQAGTKSGLAGAHTSAFYGFTDVLDQMGARRPGVVLLENVPALLSSHSGRDMVAVVAELNRLGYSVDVVLLDARRFIPHSRPRLFIVGMQTPPNSAAEPNTTLRPGRLDAIYTEPGLRMHCADLPTPPPLLSDGLSDCIEHLAPDDARWWSDDRCAQLLSSLSATQAARVSADMARTTPVFRTATQRTRGGVFLWEVRADGVAGCLRTARGGASRQAVVELGNGRIRARWMTGRDYAHLMGAGDYRLDGVRESHAMFGFGDAVCVDAVEWLARHYPLG